MPFSCRNRRRSTVLAAVTVSLVSGGLLTSADAATGAVGATPAVRTLSFTATDDGYVSSAAPNAVYDSDRLVAGGPLNDRKVSFLKFAVTGVPAGALDVTARVELARDLHHLPGQVGAAVAGNEWNETTLTAATAPSVGASVADVAPGADALGVTLPVGNVKSNGAYSYAVTSNVLTDVARFRSSESAYVKPVLTLTYTEAPAATLSNVWVGAAVNGVAADGGRAAGLDVFKQANAVTGPLRIRRSFDSSLPGSFQTSAARDDAASGLTSFVSWKPPFGDYVGAAAGKYDAAVSTWARSVPNTGVYATTFHEPENDMTGAQFVALHRHLYGVVKAANPTIKWGVVYMAYWWEAGTNHYIGDRDAWWPGAQYADYTAIDTYHPTPEPLSQDPAFRGWYDYMLDKGRPMYITEYGQYVVKPGTSPDPTMLARRASVIAQDAAWIAAQGKITMWLYWDGLGAQGNWRLDDAGSQQAWRNVASQGRTQ